MTDSAPKLRLALIHATPVAMEPIAAAFRSGWPEPELMNILDDSLAPDRARERELDAEMYARFKRLVGYAFDYGARGVLFTCSAFGPAIEAAAMEASIPVLKPNEAMFDAALVRGERIGMVATFAPAVPTMVDEFEQALSAAGRSARLETVIAEGAMDALRAGDVEGHNTRVAQAAASLAGVDAVMLAHFSTARAVQAVRERIGLPVLTAPDAAVARLRSRLGA
jgi:Asp/Glu/hydantoin racemase